MEKVKVFSNSSNVGIIGFDLGTTNSVVSAYTSDGVPTPLPIDGSPIIPSLVRWKSNGEVLIGREALPYKWDGSTAYSFKKFMGTNTKIKMDGREFTAREISTMFVSGVMAKLQKQHPEFQGIKKVLVSRPAYFDVNQTSDTVDAFSDASYTVVTTQEEPISAALVFKQLKGIERPIIVFDLGGGTFDVVLLENKVGYYKPSVKFYEEQGMELPHSVDILRVVDISGNNHLGGDDIDLVACKIFLRENNIYGNPNDYLEQAQLVKTTMSPYPTNTPEGQKDFKYEYVEEATNIIMDECMDIINKICKTTGTFNLHCVLCGGSTKSPIIRERLAQKFSISTEIDPDLAVSVGNSISAGQLANSESIPILMVTPKHIGISTTQGFRTIIKKGDFIPTTQHTYVCNAKPYVNSINLDFLQGESLFSGHTKIATLTISGLHDFDESGFAYIKVGVTIRLDGTIGIFATHNKVKVEHNLEYVAASTEPVENKHVARFRNAIELLNLDDDEYDELNRLVDNFRDTGDKSLANKINKELLQRKKVQ